MPHNSDSQDHINSHSSTNRKTSKSLHQHYCNSL